MISFLLQKIKEIDWQIFHLMSTTIKNPFLDKWMPIITNLENWIWLLVLGWVVLFIFGGRRGRLACIAVILAVLLADNFCSYVLKPYFGRVRPSVLLGLSTGVSCSFPSNHAANVFAMASVLSWYYRRFLVVWFTAAVIVGFSRIYIGVHFPTDVIGGATLGILCAGVVIWLINAVDNKILLLSKKSIEE